MIQQPELGKKIADFRKSKGFTQEELVEKCNLSVRTLQRIEAGEVTPRIYTIKLILEVLELDFENSLSSQHENDKGRIEKWLGQFYISFIDLFNLKTNAMKKVSILSIAIVAIVFGISSITNVTFGQSDSKVRKIIEKTNTDFLEYFNNGEINSLAELYRNDACLVSRGCGKEFIKNYYRIETGKYKFTEIKATSVSVSDTIAVEKGEWSAILNSGEKIGGEYLSEWRFTNKKWLIVSESSGLSFD
ncbi:MAG: helix-turn-helix domain-containing protein [Draconibacterium sp.]